VEVGEVRQWNLFLQIDSRRFHWRQDDDAAEIGAVKSKSRRPGLILAFVVGGTSFTAGEADYVDQEGEKRLRDNSSTLRLPTKNSGGRI
jgi:hypothetical protein